MNVVQWIKQHLHLMPRDPEALDEAKKAVEELKIVSEEFRILAEKPDPLHELIKTMEEKNGR